MGFLQYVHVNRCCVNGPVFLGALVCYILTQSPHIICQMSGIDGAIMIVLFETYTGMYYYLYETPMIIRAFVTLETVILAK